MYVYTCPSAGACTSGGRCVCTDGWRGLNCRYGLFLYEHNLTHFTYSSLLQLYAILSVLMEEHAAMLGSVAVTLDGEGRAAQNVSQTCTYTCMYMYMYMTCSCM